MIYIDSNVFLNEYVKSTFCGYMTDGLEEILNCLIKRHVNILNFPSDSDKKICQWNVERLIKNRWNGYNPNNNTNPIPYFSEVIKRLIAITHKNRDKVKSEYYYYQVIKQRSKKLKKLNEISDNT